MSDPFHSNQPASLPPWLKSMLVGVIIAWLGQGIGFVIWGLNISWQVGAYQQRFDDRVSALERSWSISQSVEQKLDDAQRITDQHNAVVDEKMNELTRNMEAILQNLQQDTPPAPIGGTQNSGQQNFTPAPPHTP